jgi:acyl carrier protein
MSVIEPDVELTGELRHYISSEFLLDDQSDHLEATDLLFEGGIIDSAGALSLVAHLETEYKIAVTDDELFPENFATIEHIVRFIQRKKRQRADYDQEPSK